jgi:predicted transcriptional regulator of viral defense system
VLHDFSALPSSFTLAQAREAGLSKKAVYRLRDEGALEVLGRGVYRRVDAPLGGDPDLLEVSLRAPHATLCLVTALARHGLSDALIAAADVALPRGTRPPATQTPVQWHFFHPATFALERTVLQLDERATIGLYSAERSIVDAFRLRGREGYEVANEALRRWLRRRGSDPVKLLNIAKQLPRSTTPLRHALEVLL